MKNYIVLSEVSSEAIRNPTECARMAQEISRKLRRELQWFRWQSSYVTLGSYDVVDIVEVPDRISIDEIELLFCSKGRETVDVLLATPWQEFVNNVAN